jgi:hypothetical protein
VSQRRSYYLLRWRLWPSCATVCAALPRHPLHRPDPELVLPSDPFVQLHCGLPPTHAAAPPLLRRGLQNVNSIVTVDALVVDDHFEPGPATMNRFVGPGRIRARCGAATPRSSPSATEAASQNHATSTTRIRLAAYVAFSSQLWLDERPHDLRRGRWLRSLDHFSRHRHPRLAYL